jgi:hypothetical protein
VANAPKKKRKLRKPSVGVKDECFTIMPFGGWFDDYYADIFCRAIADAGLIPRRADDLYRPSAIVHDIWAYTKSSKLILADLTGKNPNVFYELGLAHAIAKPVILVTESIADVPFDLRALRVIEYDKNSPAWGEDLRQKIKTAITEVLASPLQSVLPSFLEVDSSAPKQSVSANQKEMLEIKQELELVRREMRNLADGSASRRLPPPFISSRAEASEAIRRYSAAGMPDNIILDRWSARGVPRWLGEADVQYLPHRIKSRTKAPETTDDQGQDASIREGKAIAETEEK